ncbi:MAG: hypothetical protein WA004_20335 [Saprospiraceae bacterium]
MKDDQKLFDLFRNNEHKLHEYPSADAWLRLEKKLEAHRRRRRISLFRPIAMAAGVMLVIGIAFALGWVSHSLTQTQDSGMASLSDLPPSQGADPYAQVLSIKKQYDSVQVEEGSGPKRFRVNQAPAAEDHAFGWLEGLWQEGNVYQEWTRIDAQTFRGVSFQLSGQQRTQVKEMELRQENGVWILKEGGTSRTVSPEEFRAGWDMQKTHSQ